MQRLTQVAKRLQVGPHPAPLRHVEVVLGPQHLRVGGDVVHQSQESLRKVLRGREVERVQVSVRRKEPRVVQRAANHRDDVDVVESFENLLRDVVVAEGVLEGQVEEVGGGEFVHAGPLGQTRAGRGAAATHHVHVDVAPQLSHVVFPLTLRLAVTDVPGHGFALAKRDLCVVLAGRRVAEGELPVRPEEVRVPSVAEGPVELTAPLRGSERTHEMHG